MASGKVHFAGNIINGTILTVGAYLYSEEAVPLIIIGSILGTLITPDMDLEGTTFTERLMRKIPIIGLLFQNSWYIYSLLTKHRGLSHNILFGTLTRIIWFVFIISFWLIFINGIMITFYNTNLHINIDLYINNFFICIVSWYLQDINHYILDFVFNERNRNKG